MREGQGICQLSGSLPIVPALEPGEVISSWLDRIARFYGLSLVELLADHAGLVHPLEAINEVDLGNSPRALNQVARLVGLSVEALAPHTLLGACPWARDLVSQARSPARSDRTPNLRYAACPICLEQQRALRGFSWLRRDWLLAPRTVCSVHHVELVEMEEGSPCHPAWQCFLRRYELEIQQPVCVTLRASIAASEQDKVTVDGTLEDPLYRLMAGVQGAMIARAMLGTSDERQGEMSDLTRVVDDLVWAFTRNDGIYRDRLVYEAFASPGLDNPWHIARRRCVGPVAFRNLILEARHRILATAIVLAGPGALRMKFFGLDRTWEGDMADLRNRLDPNDRAELVERQRRWPGHASLPG